MGRSRKNGLDYFPFDIDTFQDIKIRKLIKYQSGKAVTIYASLLCLIYKNGYYMKWDKELPFIISEMTGFEEAYISEVIKSCMTLGLFSKELFESCGVLTSEGVQERYRSICRQLKRKCDFGEYILISSEEKGISSEEKGISSEEIPINPEKKGISSEKFRLKEKEREIKEISLSREKEKAEIPEGYFTPDELGARLSESSDWLRMQPLNIFRQTGIEVSEDSVLALIGDYVCKLKAEGVACKPLDDARSHFANWAVKFLKSQDNGNNRANYTSKQEANDYAFGLLMQHKRELEEGVPGAVERPF